jgi:hypothetical protein
LVLLDGLVLLRLVAKIDVVPWLTTIETTAITDVMWGCIRLWSLLLSTAELKVL